MINCRQVRVSGGVVALAVGFGGRVWRGTVPEWRVPAVTEQYDCYVPVDSSAAKLALAFLEIGKASGDKADIAKARALGDNLVNMQMDNGNIPTFWTGKVGDGNWLNCLIFDTQALQALSEL